MRRRYVKADQSSRAGQYVAGRRRRRQLDAVASVLDVAWVETFTFHEKHNEYGGGAIIGANTANANGYDGSSQIAAVADTDLGGGTTADPARCALPNRH
jgi:hypothetical protein